MRIVRLLILACAFAALGAVGFADASTQAIPAPTGLHGFLLMASERSTTVFHRTPSFAWKPVRGADHYELQLSTSSTFRENGILYDDTTVLTPVAAPTLTLPWITGSPHSLYARVRAIFAGGKASPWGKPFGFDVVPPAAPTQLSSYPGLLRWTPVEGADRYQVWLVDAGKIETVNTNVLDEREFYAFHPTQPWIGTVRWRVRALRFNVLGRLNSLPVAPYGPWSPIYRSTNSTPADAPIRLTGTVSDVFSNGGRTSAAHQLMPAFLWTGDETLDGTPAPFVRVEVFTDSSCLNRVFTSSTIASPAYAPRLSGPLEMPTNTADESLATTHFLLDGTEKADVAYDGETLTPTEQEPDATPTTSIGKNSGTLTFDGTTGAPLDLWDVDWPSSGYYWTVMPVYPVVLDDGSIVYVDMELSQDVCASGRVARFGISSQPSLTSKQQPFATGLSSTGKLVSAAQTPRFYGEPLVAWTPAFDAMAYEVQWAHHAYPFAARGTRLTYATSSVLPLRPGTWYYRVRGFDFNLPTGAQAMAWSTPTKIVVTAPKFRVTSVRHRSRRHFKVVR
ncbi:MAG: hypothetical protein ACRDLM_00200 [Gaiellaceae bacterium]